MAVSSAECALVDASSARPETAATRVVLNLIGVLRCWVTAFMRLLRFSQVRRRRERGQVITEAHLQVAPSADTARHQRLHARRRAGPGERLVEERLRSL